MSYDSATMPFTRPGACDHLKSWVLIALTALALGQPAHAGVIEKIFSSGFEASLDCEREGYPCSLADASPAAIARVETLLQEIWDVRHGGTLEDVRTYLESQPDVVEVGGNHRYVSFRVEGMSPAIFDDVTVTRGNPSASALDFGRASLHKAANQRAVGNTRTVRGRSKQLQAVPGYSSQPSQAEDYAGTVIASPQKGMKSDRQPRIEEVVGEDINMDGIVDQRDIKRALVLAPYLWDFAPNDESADLASRLELLPGYAGNVVFKSNPNRDDANITIEDWLFLHTYDVAAFSTHGSRQCEILPDLSNDCEVWISSGVAHEWGAPWPANVGLSASGYYDDTDMESQSIGRISLGLDFWRFYYNGALDNQLVVFSACETANSEGGTLAAAMGGDDFVMAGWTEAVYSSVAFPTALAFHEELAKGITTREAFENISELGLFPYVDDENIEVSFEVFSPGDDEVRVIELPRLMYRNSVMSDGTNIAALVSGTVGDESPDSLQLTVQIDGVTPDSKAGFQVRYRVGDQEVPGAYTLASATLVDGFEYRYEVTHDVALGFPLLPGNAPIEVIVDLPEGGDSRFSVMTSVASCAFNAQVSGDTSATFDGPAQFQVGNDGALLFAFRSRGLINSDPATSVEASFQSYPATPAEPGEKDILAGSINFDEPLYGAVYIEGQEFVDCPDCGGTVIVESVEAEQTLAGSASLTLVRTVPQPPEGVKPLVTLNVDFVAAFGYEFGDTPYVECLMQYEEVLPESDTARLRTE